MQRGENEDKETPYTETARSSYTNKLLARSQVWRERERHIEYTDDSLENSMLGSSVQNARDDKQQEYNHQRFK